MRTDFLQAVDPNASPIERPALLAALSQEKFRLADEQRKDMRAVQERTRDEQDSAITVMLVTELDRVEEQELRISIERHDRAVIEALIENEERLAVANRQVEKLLGDAHVLPDGRRVFKTENGQRVFDEFGKEVGADELDPDVIERRRPSWESYREGAEDRNALMAERQDLLDYQQKLDTAQERMDAGDMGADDLAELDRMMREDAPESVRRHLPEGDPAALATPERAAPETAMPRYSPVAVPGSYNFQ